MGIIYQCSKSQQNWKFIVLFKKLTKNVSKWTFYKAPKISFLDYIFPVEPEKQFQHVSAGADRFGILTFRKGQTQQLLLKTLQVATQVFPKKVHFFHPVANQKPYTCAKKTNLKTHFCFSWQFFWTGFAKSCQCFHETSTIKFSLFHLKFARFFLSNFQWLVISMSQIHPLKNFQLCFRYQKSESPNFPKTVQKFR